MNEKYAKKEIIFCSRFHKNSSLESIYRPFLETAIGGNLQPVIYTKLQFFDTLITVNAQNICQSG